MSLEMNEFSLSRKITFYTGTPGEDGEKQAKETKRIFLLLLSGACATNTWPPANGEGKLRIYEGPLNTIPFKIVIPCEKPGDEGVLQIAITFRIVVVYNPFIRSKQWALEATTIMTDERDEVIHQICVPYTTRQNEIEWVKNFVEGTVCAPYATM